MKILLHVCCAPCLIYPLEVLRQEGFSVEAYFYNPNIYPEEEFIKRKQVFLDFADTQGVPAHVAGYAPLEYATAVTEKESPRRCLQCWDIRLIATASFAKENNFTHFSTALLVSPYQDIEAIHTIGEAVAQKYGVGFLYRDFRPGFREAHAKARAMGIYCQKYCGCKCSLEERNSALLKNKKRGLCLY
ncbi:MAG: hypothetical protein A2Y00_09320 [Omnitrophica WOR_2 bacterium GWF2_43_52]|nr:MAG: hypothetical protein A2062_06530 [Omnitrophica WOR_2 bacterium GWA2_44_7]OGX18139.1 MAG: hypothetical protein A2Y01_04945 [Omnitrophica WOR_2 bacterium GWC2_44_8]OGX21959.1 MAG: hypothetical protein A2Y00_09320 [Omnitrophica WOR_2 bacterium GWF2_43_52]OGX54120.1 MAG: hypothetical protein A2460_03885 [Omnitrophica WOR_2 bacterium RIFOXYC2_FULL_43_9]HAH20031.1 hypothetical protein [Candidatus Omnitrophota bacterium]